MAKTPDLNYSPMLQPNKHHSSAAGLKTALVLLCCLLTCLSFFPLTSAAQDVRLRSCRMRTARQAHHGDTNLAKRRAQTGAKYIGDRRQLVVMASFSDQDFATDDYLLLWDDIFNAEDYSKEPFVGSVYDYFCAQSYGQLRLHFDLVPLTVGPRVRYHSTDEDDENSQYLIYDIAHMLATMDIDWPAYDWDADGYIDQLLVIYAGRGMNDGGDSITIWPHQWWLSEHIDPETNLPAQPRQITTDDGSTYTIDTYCAVQELDSKDSYGTFGTLCHEYSHCFGLPDFYYGSTSFVGAWDIMDYGNFNGGGYRPCGYSAHERWFMGWLKLTELKEPTTVSGMAALGDEPQAYLIRSGGNDDEYYIVENRQQTGWDEGLPGSGILVFHVDFDYDVWMGYSEWPNTELYRRYDIFAANNKRTRTGRKGWGYPFETNDSLTDTSTPAATLNSDNSDGTRLMHKPLTAMTVDGGLASFDFMGGRVATAIGSANSDKDAPDVIYDLSGRRIRRTGIARGLYIVNGRKKAFY